MKIGQFMVKISKILEINENHINTSYGKLLDHLDHLWTLFCHFKQFLSFLPLYKGMYWLGVIPHLVLFKTDFERLVRFRRSWAFFVCWTRKSYSFLHIFKTQTSTRGFKMVCVCDFHTFFAFSEIFNTFGILMLETSTVAQMKGLELLFPKNAKSSGPVYT